MVPKDESGCPRVALLCYWGNIGKTDSESVERNELLSKDKRGAL